MQISPSILNSDFLQLGNTIELLNKSDAEYIHLDVMDGVFVPNISIGQPIVSCVKNLAKKPLDVHLMIVDPDRFVDSFAEAGANILTVQYEACTHLHRVISHIKSRGMLAGVALNPHTPVNVLEEIITELDLVLIMSVNPGFGGQSFIHTSLDKIKRLKELILQKNSKAVIEVDGGINRETAPLCREAGAEVFVIGSAIFSSKEPAKEIEFYKNIK